MAVYERTAIRFSRDHDHSGRNHPLPEADTDTVHHSLIGNNRLRRSLLAIPLSEANDILADEMSHPDGCAHSSNDLVQSDPVAAAPEQFR
ncbi:hypothetical protein [Sphingomonas oryzagri]